MEESPEQILARLVQYRESLSRPPRVPWDANAGIGSEPAPAPARVWQQVAEPRPHWIRSTLATTVGGQLLAVLACTLAVQAFEQLGAAVALGLVVAATASGLIAAVRRVPLALWWTLGVVIGGVLGRWS